MRLLLIHKTLSFYLQRFFVCALLLTGVTAQAQEIEARAYSNAPICINFASLGIGQASSGNYKLTTEAASFTRIFDAWGQSGKISLVLPYAELTGTGKLGTQTINASSEGLSDPLIKASVNLYGAPALTLDQFKSYQQDLIIGASLAASIPWGQYNSQQMLNVGANRWFVQPGLGVSNWLVQLLSIPATIASWVATRLLKIQSTQPKPMQFITFPIQHGFLQMPPTTLAVNHF